MDAKEGSKGIHPSSLMSEGSGASLAFYLTLEGNSYVR